MIVILQKILGSTARFIADQMAQAESGKDYQCAKQNEMEDEKTAVACRGQIPSVQTDLKMTPNGELPNNVGVELNAPVERVCRVLGRRTTIANGRKVPSHRPSHYGTNGRMMT